MKTIGITGGIGSGKTTVCKILSVFNIPVYYADVRAKELYDEDVEMKEKVIELLGKSVYTKDGLSRAEVAGKVFNDKALLQQLNAIVHPAVERDFIKWTESHSDATIVVKEAAILFENGGYKKMDFNVLITAPEQLRIDRVMKRDGVSEEQVKARISNQWPDEEKIPLADFVIKCDEHNLVIPQVMEVKGKVESRK
jgi:dephospho-CoA kinase